MQALDAGELVRCDEGLPFSAFRWPVIMVWSVVLARLGLWLPLATGNEK